MDIKWLYKRSDPLNRGITVEEVLDALAWVPNFDLSYHRNFFIQAAQQAEELSHYAQLHQKAKARRIHQDYLDTLRQAYASCARPGDVWAPTGPGSYQANLITLLESKLVLGSKGTTNAATYLIIPSGERLPFRQFVPYGGTIEQPESFNYDGWAGEFTVYNAEEAQ